MLQVVFHGVSRSQALETDIAERYAALNRFDRDLGDCKVTITRISGQGQGEMSAKVDLIVGGQRQLVATENAIEAGAAVNKVFDTIRRMVKDENDKRHAH